MAEEIRLPPLGQTSDEMSIVEWYKKEGDSVSIGEPLLSVETDKAQVDVESAEEGIVLKIIAQPGELLTSGSLLAYVGVAGEELIAEQAPVTPTVNNDAPPEVVGVTTEELVTQTDEVSSHSRPQLSPVLRKLATSLGVDLSQVKGSGPNGRIERVDIESFVQHNEVKPGATTDEASTVSAVRQVIARRLTRSVQSIPQFTVDITLDARPAQNLMKQVEGLTYSHVLLRAMALSARENPSLLRVWQDEGPSYRVLPPNIGLAVAGDDSLLVVTIPEPDLMEIGELVLYVRKAVERARSSALTAEDQLPTSLSLSNLGMFGVDSFHAIVDPDQTAIIAAGAVMEKVVVIDGKPEVIPQMNVSISCDHRSADGVQAARFLQSLKRFFEAG
jgi:pyruvate dehydrogenase E2 component (dihydrolipoamide acetyltransferase)